MAERLKAGEAAGEEAACRAGEEQPTSSDPSCAD